MGDNVWMWRVPGYGDVLADRDSDLRTRHAAAGVPAGFSDAVGWLAPVADTVHAGWAVTFAVDDTDAVADRAKLLGGAVLVAPYDEGPVRLANLRDPQGATFTISHYTG